MSKGILKVTGTIVNDTSILIGSGQDERSDADVLLDEVSNMPYIPSTSFVGVLRRILNDSGLDNDQLDKLFGYTKGKDVAASKFSCSDLLPVGEHRPQIVIRDNVKIDSKTGIAEDKKKFDFEVVEPGAVFNLSLICKYDDEVPKDFALQTISSLKMLINEGSFRLGKKTMSGLGKISWKNGLTVQDYDFSIKNSVIAWLCGKDGVKADLPDVTLKSAKNEFRLDAWFDLKTSLIVRSYPGDPTSPDATNLKSAGRNIIPGTSIKGAIRARAERILNTLDSKPDDTDSILKSMFGYVDDTDRKKKAIKSRVRVEETELCKEKFAELIQSRVKIDRFTGGAINGALFDSMPLFRRGKSKDQKDKVINIRITLQNPKEHEKGLLLLILKDLWTGDLALGGEKNVGRGVLQGVCCKMIDTDSAPIAFVDPDKLSKEDQDKLKRYVNILNMGEK